MPKRTKKGIDTQFSYRYDNLNNPVITPITPGESTRKEEVQLMKSTGIVRRLDDSGRFVVPIELRKSLDLEDRAAMEIYTHGDTILLRRYQPFCTFCGHNGTSMTHYGKHICPQCLSNLVRAPSEPT